MADIKRRFGLRHLRGSATAHIRHQVRGRVKHAGTGQSFWFRALTAVLSEVPGDDQELPLLFHARTADFQDVTVQATVSYRVADPERAAGRVDFSIDPDTGRWRAAPLEQLAGLLTELAQQHAFDLLARTDLSHALAEGMGPVRDRVTAGLRDDPRVGDTGIEIVNVRVVALRPAPDVEKALQTPTREQVQQEADRATYERRALAVERERAISENELHNKIALAKRTEQLLEQEGANARRKASEDAAAERIRAESTVERERLAAQSRAETERLTAAARAEAVRLVGEAEADTEARRLAAYAELGQPTLLALAAKELAGNMPKIHTLNVTPDMLSQLLSTLTERGPEPGKR